MDATRDEPDCLTGRIDEKFKPVFEACDSASRKALFQYFLPTHSRKPRLAPTRPRLIKWYCPFASQKVFPSGHRYCLNVYAGCGHRCLYCYAAAYSPERPAPKRDFERLLRKDLEDLERFNVPPAPVHLSNSTDPFQPLEARHGHARLALEKILETRHRFSTVTVLTKNPLGAATRGCLELFKALTILPEGHPRHAEFSASGIPPFCVEVSLAFWRQEPASVYDPCAPTPEERREGIRRLRAAGIPVVLRIDPLFPRSPLPGGLALNHFGLAEAQTLQDLEQLVRFAKDMAVRHVVYSTVKIVQPRGRPLDPVMGRLRLVFEKLAAPGRPPFHSGSWRLPTPLAGQVVVQPFLALCADYGVQAKHCMRNLIEAP